MGKLFNAILKSLRLIVVTFRDFSNGMDNVNTAWHEGKALENFQVAVRESGEIAETAKVFDVSVELSKSDLPTDQVSIIIVTEAAPSKTVVYKIRRILKSVNSRFHTHLTAQIIQRPTELMM